MPLVQSATCLCVFALFTATVHGHCNLAEAFATIDQGTCKFNSDGGISADPINHAVVTLLTVDTGYLSGAMAISGALEKLGSTARRVCMVTPNVPETTRDTLRKSTWEVLAVDEILCNHKMGAEITPDKYDLSETSRYAEGVKKWSGTCTKFKAFDLPFEKVLFLDADTIPLENLDHLFFVESEFAAAPETFPPDNFNSGVMVLTPSEEQFQGLLRFNAERGSEEGGDQGVLNAYFNQWYNVSADDQKCGRLLWRYNVNAANHKTYSTLSKMRSQPPPALVHFVANLKPWVMYVMHASGQQIPEEAMSQLEVHMLWRSAFHFMKELGGT